MFIMYQAYLTAEVHTQNLQQAMSYVTECIMLVYILVANHNLVVACPHKIHIGTTE
jgi:hypothetical protein